ncbi:hypothetical protein CEXT_582131 [Caerostris extrusa]|uniref:Uncharacterized protein n=1 Tax=Caerostris extrusa TaxID=172846 RepID=A0AAV4MCU9_CAEEX|nr:hypothetical protein CEXT_582131 [Caerostris extrusa]
MKKFIDLCRISTDLFSMSNILYTLRYNMSHHNDALSVNGGCNDVIITHQNHASQIQSPLTKASDASEYLVRASSFGGLLGLGFECRPVICVSV